MRQTLLVLLSLAPLSAAQAATPTDCIPARMMFVLDHSSSMNGVVDASMKTKWAIARQAVGTISTSYESKINLGLNVFPNPGQCAPGRTLVAPAGANATKIIAALPAAPPATGNYTPMAESVDAAAADLLGGAAMADPMHRPTLLLVTDGWQWCYPYDAKTRTWPIDAVKRALAKGIQVYVVGFGSEVDVATLNQMAVAAGTALAGCDPTGTDVTSPNKCYYQADSAVQLNAALDSISVKVSAEVCDGVDNDCNGLVDENLTRNCANACGSGVETCAQGNWNGCSAPNAAAAEVCGDGKDNDCNGSTDEGCFCQPGETRACGNVNGVCGQNRGAQTCSPAGKWSACLGAAQPSGELCNGIDDDCNGFIDEGSPSTLCAQGGVCQPDGTCHDPFNATGAGTGGCGCDVGGGERPLGVVPVALLLIGLAALGLRRRVKRY